MPVIQRLHKPIEVGRSLGSRDGKVKFIDELNSKQEEREIARDPKLFESWMKKMFGKKEGHNGIK